MSRVLRKLGNSSGCQATADAPRACPGGVQELVLVVGRVCCDSEGRLNERSVLLEGSVELSGGHRVRLDLSKLDAFRIFPGQVSCRLALLQLWLQAFPDMHARS